MKLIKKYKGFILGVFVGLINFETINVFSATILSSSGVSYDNSTSKGSYTNVQNSIDELYTKVNTATNITYTNLTADNIKSGTTVTIKDGAEKTLKSVLGTGGGGAPTLVKFDYSWDGYENWSYKVTKSGYYIMTVSVSNITIQIQDIQYKGGFSSVTYNQFERSFNTMRTTAGYATAGSTLSMDWTTNDSNHGSSVTIAYLG